MVPHILFHIEFQRSHFPLCASDLAFIKDCDLLARMMHVFRYISKEALTLFVFLSLV